MITRLSRIRILRPRFALGALLASALLAVLVFAVSAAGTATAARSEPASASAKGQLRLKVFQVPDRLARMKAGRL